MSEVTVVSPLPAAPAPEVPPAAPDKTVVPPKRHGSFMTVFTPNVLVPRTTQFQAIGIWLVIGFLFWSFSPLPILPRPPEVLAALVTQYQQGIIYQLFSSLGVSLQAIALATIFGLGLSYLSTVAALKPAVKFFGSLRTSPIAGFMILFVLMTPNGHWLKVSVLAFTIMVFLVDQMVNTIENIPLDNYEHFRTLGFNEFQVTREVVIRATLPQAFDNLRGNAAMAWITLPFVEGISRSEGGVGVILLNLDRHMDIAATIAVSALIVLVGIGQDWLIKFAKGLVCPYTKL